MEIEKICRTCLCLNGPLLSLYDGNGSDSTGCLADMLACFTKMKPTRLDNMPEKVCLACISEINRCYSFKMKCENSNRALRQLLPDAVPEEADEDDKLPMENKSVQTTGGNWEEPEKHTVTVEVQTTCVERSEQTHQFVQTEAELYDMEKKSVEATEDNEEVNEELNLEKESKSELFPEEYIGRLRKRVAPLLLNSESLQKRKRVSSPVADILEEGSDHEIIFELQDSEEAYEQQAAKNPGLEEETASYYEISDSPVDFEEEFISEGEEQQTNENETFVEELIISEDTERNQRNGEGVKYKFTILNNDNEEETESEPPVKEKPKTRQTKEKVEYKCPQCIMTFVTRNPLKRHLLKMHGMKQEIQPIAFSKKRSSRRKLAETAEVDQNEAEERPRKSQTPPADMESAQPVVVQTTPAELKFFCKVCNAGFAQSKSLSFHYKLNICSAVTYKCEECARVFISEEALEEHKDTHLLSIVCNECNMQFETMEELSYHMVEVHDRSMRNRCEICQKVFTMLSTLKDHMRIHSGEKPFLCTICGKTFSQNANLKQHVMRHSKVKKFKCDECDNSYVTKAELFSHKRTHNGDQPFKCNCCEAAFTTSSSLVKHKRKHTGERPYACDLCPMRFSTLNVLKNHRRIHTAEKPFKCSYCNKIFTQKGDCQAHLRTHTGERNYRCLCGMRFTHLSTLRSHENVHIKNIQIQDAVEPDGEEITIIETI